MLNKAKKMLTIALAAVAFTTASVAFTGDAFAKGGKGGGKRLGWHRGVFLSAPVVVPVCWQWINGKKVWVCY
jgi:hypothetical protein